MGTDIYTYAEINVNNKWMPVLEPNIFEETVLNIKTGNIIMEAKDLDFGRNRNFFNFLANFDNDFDVSPAFLMQGLPSDLCPIIRDMSERRSNYIHSHGWFMCKDFLDFNFNEKLTFQAYVPNDAAHLFKQGEEGFPKKQWKSEYKVFSKNLADIFAKEDRDFFYNHTKVFWKIKYSDYIGNIYLEETKEKLKKLGDLKKVRVMYWFG